jgi:hypothetical protein
VPVALFSHPQTHYTNGKAATGGQPAYENLFQEPTTIPTRRETVD